MLKRKIDEKLDFWFKNRKQALLVTGARQIGKSYSISHFIKSRFENAIKIDFSERTDLIDTFATFDNSEDLLLRLSLVNGSNMVPYKTVIFFDEIQLLYRRREELKKKNALLNSSQDIITAMKSLAQNGEYRFILSGSLLGVTIHDINLNPTGYLDEIKMYPLDFEEYLWAKNVGDLVINHIKNCFDNKIPVDEEINRMLIKLFKEYVIVGGMPEAVQTFISTKNFYHVQVAQEQILNRYKLDITTYVLDKSLKLRIRDVFNAVPSQLSNKNMRYISSQVLDKQYLKHKKIEDEFLWLNASKVAIPVYHVNEPVIPLSLSVERKVLKLFSNDVGLLMSQLVDSGIREKLLNNEKEINYGSPYENAAAQLLIAHGFDEEVYYYNSKKHGEVDFLLTYNGDVLPIEIKSGKSKESQIYDHYALNHLIKNYSYHLSYVFGETNVIKESEVIYQLPIYMIDLIKK